MSSTKIIQEVVGDRDLAQDVALAFGEFMQSLDTDRLKRLAQSALLSPRQKLHVPGKSTEFRFITSLDAVMNCSIVCGIMQTTEEFRLMRVGELVSLETIGGPVLCAVLHKETAISGTDEDPFGVVMSVALLRIGAIAYNDY